MASRERMKREMLALFEEISRLRPLVLFLDDLHWADDSTVDLLAYLSRRLASIRVLLLVAYRQSEMILNRHPFVAVPAGAAETESLPRDRDRAAEPRGRNQLSGGGNCRGRYYAGTGRSSFTAAPKAIRSSWPTWCGTCASAARSVNRWKAWSAICPNRCGA